MRAVDHYREAEQQVAEAETIGDADLQRELVATAMVHAFLAVAGAHALNAYSTGDEQELEDWQAAAGGAE